MAINKVIFKDRTLMDITDTTAEASNVTKDKVFYDMAGIRTLGTFVEQPGLEYEEGTFTPEEDITEPTIYFTNTHEKSPIMWVICDVTDNGAPDNNTSAIELYVDPYRIWGTKYYINETTNGYGYLYGAINRNSNFFENFTSSFSHSSDEEIGLYNITSYPKNYCDNTCIKPKTKTTYGYWRANRTYKWIAVWK